MSMDYFRRPALVGNNLTRTIYAQVRGSFRRNDQDALNAAPYFPAASGGQALDFSVDGTPYVATLTDNTYLGALNAINTALGVHGSALDLDGVIGIQTVTQGYAGSVQITGGSAAPNIGFDLSQGPIFAVGGDVPSGPEARLANWYGVALPGVGENFTSDTLGRIAGRLAANSDVLYSDDAREEAILVNVPYTISPTPAEPVLNDTVTAQFLTPSPATTRLFTAFGVLSRSSSEAELAPFFQLIDRGTKLPAISKVIAVSRGFPSFPLPFADATAWSGGGSAGNILGIDLIKTTVAITSIENDSVVVCAGAGFTGFPIQVGDLAEISGATNTVPWSNNGLRWVVESVISDIALKLRPMSQSELAMMGQSFNDNQPILELNSAAGTLGSIKIHTGTFCENVNLVVSPPIPFGAVYDLWAASPVSGRNRQASYVAESEGAPMRGLADTNETLPNGIISGLEASLSAGNCVISAGNFRWNGRVYALPTATITPAAFGAPGTFYVYVDNQYPQIAFTSSASGFNSLYNGGSAGGHLIGQVVVTGGPTISAVNPATRKTGEKARSITVGDAAQFSSLEEALGYVNDWGAAYAEDAFSSGIYPHWEVLLVSNMVSQGTNSLNINVPGVKIRCINSNITYTLAGGDSFNVTPATTGGTFSLENMLLAMTTAGSPVVNVSSGSAVVVYVNGVTQLYDGVTNLAASYAFLSNNINCSLLMKDSAFFVSVASVATGTATMQSLILDRSSFTGEGSNRAMNIGTTTINLLKISNCTFSNFIGALASPMIDCSGVVKGTISDNRFVGCYSSSLNGSLISSASPEFVCSGNAFTGTQGGIYAGGAGVFSNNYINGQASIAGQIVYCSIASKNTVITTDAISGSSIFLATRSITGNYISGPVDIGMQSFADDCVISNNTILQSNGASLTASSAGIQIRNNRVVCSGNTIVSTMTTVNALIRFFPTLPSNNCVVSNNSLGDGTQAPVYGAIFAGNATGPALGDSDQGVIEGNSINLSAGYGITLLGGSWDVSGNYVIATNCIGLGGTTNAIVISSNTLTGTHAIEGNSAFALGNPASIQFNGNVVNCTDATGGGNNISLVGNTFTANVSVSAFRISGNTFRGTVAISSLGASVPTDVQGNTFLSTVTMNFGSNTYDASFSNNRVVGAFSITTIGNFECSGCVFESSFTVSADISSLIIADCIVENGISVTSSTQNTIKIDGCTLNSGITLLYTNSTACTATINNNSINAGGQDGILISSTSAPHGGLNGLTICNNTITVDNSRGGTPFAPIHIANIAQLSFITITGNYLEFNDWTGTSASHVGAFLVDNTASNVNSISFSGNVCLRPGTTSTQPQANNHSFFACDIASTATNIQLVESGNTYVWGSGNTVSNGSPGDAVGSGSSTLYVAKGAFKYTASGTYQST